MKSSPGFFEYDILKPMGNGVQNPPPPQARASTQALETPPSQPGVQEGMDAAKQAAQKAAAAEAAGHKGPKMLETTPPAAEFISVFNSLFHEGYENYSPPKTDQGAGVFSEGQGGSQKDMMVLREFIREMNQLIKEGMTLSQMLNQIKVEQGGMFWAKVQQILQKEMLLDKQTLMQRLAGKGTGLDLGALEKEGGLEMARQNPGKAMLEMIKAETNPRGQLESMILALQLMKQDGFQESSEKLITYLKQRWGMSDDEMRRFLQHYHVAFFQGPMPRREEVRRGSPWYLLTLLLSIPIAILLGMGFLDATILGVLLTAAAFFVVSRWK